MAMQAARVWQPSAIDRSKKSFTAKVEERAG
jgi:hypothetical protein